MIERKEVGLPLVYDLWVEGSPHPKHALIDIVPLLDFKALKPNGDPNPLCNP